LFYTYLGVPSCPLRNPEFQVDNYDINKSDKAKKSNIVVKSISIDNSVKSSDSIQAKPSDSQAKFEASDHIQVKEVDSTIQVESVDLNNYHINNVNNTKKGDLKTMKKIIKIEGMFCPHCSGRVEQVLNQIDGVSATVDLEHKQAKVKLNQDINNQILIDTITDAGYEVVEIIEV